MNKLVEIYCDVDDFYQLFIEQWQQTLLEDGVMKRHRACRFSVAEIMTIIILFYQSHYPPYGRIDNWTPLTLQYELV